MYNKEMQESMKKVAANRAENAALEPRRMTAEEKDTLLATYHPDYKQDQFATLQIGPNKGEKVPLELADLLQAHSRINTKDINLDKVDYDVDVLIIGGTSLSVYPASGLIEYYKGNKLVLINKSTTQYDDRADLLISESIGETLDYCIN